MKKARIKTLLSVAVFASTGAQAAPSFKTYGAKGPEGGETELVYWADYVANSPHTATHFGKAVDREGTLEHTLEAEYGLNNRWTLGAYADFANPSDESFAFTQGRGVLRYHVGEHPQLRFDSAIYFEYYVPREDYFGESNQKLEGRLILQKDFGATSVKLNPILEKIVSGPDSDEGLEVEYAASIYHAITPKLEVGLETYGGMGELADLGLSGHSHYLLPALEYKFNEELSWNVGVAFGMSGASDDTIVKSILEFEL